MSKKYRLTSYDVVPPGGYVFVQTKGIHHVFPAQPVIEAQAQIVSSFRKANGLPRASIRESLEDVDRFTAFQPSSENFRVEINPDNPGQLAMNSSNSIISPPCQTCGIPVGQ